MAILLEIYFFLVYLTIGPLAWGIFIYGMNKGRKRLKLLKRPIDALPDDPPHVTILIPAKDEAGRIRECLVSALAQDYPSFDVIAIDDRSIDETGAIMDELASADERLQVLHIRGESPPAGWTGKCNALHRAIDKARGQWLLFVDSDVVLQPDVLRATIAVAIKRHYNLLSLMPAFEGRSFWERLLVPLAGCAVSSMYLVPLGRPFANGQYLCIKRDAYDAIGGHAAVHDKFCEDVEMARRLKSIGGRPRMSWGADFVSVRMYSSLGAILRGWGRNFFAASLGRPWRIVAAMGFVIACCFSAYAAVVFGGAYRLAHDAPISGSIWLAFSLLHLAMMTAAVGVMYRWTRNSAAHALIFPLASMMLMAVFLRALWMCYTGRVEWRGTRYTHRMTPSATQATS